MAAGNFNNADSANEIVYIQAINNWGAAVTAGAIYVQDFNTGFSQVLPGVTAIQVIAADITGDGRDEVVFIDNANNLRSYNFATSSFTTHGSGYSDVTAGQIDGDANIELLAATTTTAMQFYDPTTNTFSSAAGGGAGNNVAANLNGNGLTDFAVRSGLNNGSGSLYTLSDPYGGFASLGGGLNRIATGNLDGAGDATDEVLLTNSVNAIYTHGAGGPNSFFVLTSGAGTDPTVGHPETFGDGRDLAYVIGTDNRIYQGTTTWNLASGASMGYSLLRTFASNNGSAAAGGNTTNFFDILAADLDNDGLDEIIARKTTEAGSAIYVFKNTTAGLVQQNAFLKTSDAAGTSSFNTAGNWSDLAAPHAGIGYDVGTGRTLRTPNATNPAAFAGTSLNIYPGGELSLESTGTVTVNGLNLNGGVVSHGGNPGNTDITLAGSINLLANSTFDTNGRNIIASALISGAGGLIKEDAGTLTLTNLNPYTGGTTVNGGILALQGDNAPTGTIRGTLTINSGAEARVTAGQWTLGYDSAPGAYVHTITIENGTLNFQVNGGTNAQTINMTGGTIMGSFDLYNSTTAVSDVDFNTFANATSATVTSNITMRLNGNAAGGGTLKFNVADGAAAADLIVSGNLLGDATQRVEKSGAGWMRMSGTHTYSGGTTVSGGVLELQGNNAATGTIRGALTIKSGAETRITAGQWTLGYDSAPGAYVHTITIENGTLNFQVNGGTNAQTINMTGGTIMGSFDLYNSTTAVSDVDFNTFANATSATVTSNITMRLNGNAAGGGTLKFNVADGAAAADLIVSGNLLGDATQRVEKSGAGLMQMSGTNTYAGSTTVNQGVLSISSIANGGASSNIGASTNAAANLVLGGGTLQYTGGTASTNRNYTLTAGTTSKIDVANAASNLTISGASASSTGALVKTGLGTLTLSGFNNHTGGTTVDNGVLVLQGTNGFTGVIRGALTINAGAEARVTQGQWTLGYDSGPNYVDTITINGGTLNFAVGTGGTNALAINMDGGSITGSPFHLYNHFTSTHDVAFTTAANALTATVSPDILLRIGESVGGGTLNFDVADGAASTDLLVSGAVSAVSNTQLVAKDGPGLMVFSGNNTYSGTTHVIDGTLVINGTTSGQGTYTVESGARLGGKGTIGLAGGAGVNVSPNPGEVSPGGAAPSFVVPATPGGYMGEAFDSTYSAGLAQETVGTLTIGGNLNLDGKLLLDFISPNANEYDFLNVIGTLAIPNSQGTAELEINGETDFTQINFWEDLGLAGLRIDLVHFGAISGAFGNIAFNTQFLDASGNPVVLGVDGSSIFLLAVPEPATIALWSLLGLVAVGWQFRRRTLRA